MTRALRITNGRVFDPANGIDGRVGTVHVCDGRIVADLPAGASARTIDAAGMVVMPAGVDVHCHIASSALNQARAMQGEEHATHVHHACSVRGLRAGSGRVTPSTFLTGQRYAALGYGTAVEAAVAPSAARQTHLQLDDTPAIDAAFLLLVANHQRVIELLDRGDEGAVVALIGELMYRTGAYGIKVVNPGGVAAWRADATRHAVETIDDTIAGTAVTPRRILEVMAAAAEHLGLAHPPHIHCNRLGLPGNVDITLATLDALAGRRAHLTHLQFHAYGRTARGEACSAAERLCAWLDDHPEVSADVGQVVFGEALTLSADTPLEHLLWQLTGERSHTLEVEAETGCGLMPIVYRDRHYLHSLQWSIGLELMLRCADPWRMLLSTDHPNGGSFLSYPAIIAALMSVPVRREQLQRAHARVARHSALAGIEREFTLSEIAILTRAGPARVLGMHHKGHLGPGADADVTVYHDAIFDPQRMFESPRYVIKAGHVLVEDGELRGAVAGARMRADVEPDERGAVELTNWFEAAGSYDVRQLGLHDAERARMRTVGRGQ